MTLKDKVKLKICPIGQEKHLFKSHYPKRRNMLHHGVYTLSHIIINLKVADCLVNPKSTLHYTHDAHHIYDTHHTHHTHHTLYVVASAKNASFPAGNNEYILLSRSIFCLFYDEKLFYHNVNFGYRQ